jgi:hypothetical protein
MTSKDDETATKTLKALDFAGVHAADRKLYLCISIDCTSNLAFVQLVEGQPGNGFSLPGPPDRRCFLR